MRTSWLIAAIVILGVVATAAVSLAQFQVAWSDLLASPNLESAGELPDTGGAVIDPLASQDNEASAAGEPEAAA
ncbi:MAG TPA: hypothetical protein VHB99_11380, partial [Pirellulales bacterium]|nr:hypothetical protein [Pirellulales bacterium]